MSWCIDNAVNQKALKVLFDYAVAHKLKFRHLKTLSLESNDLTDYDITTLCRAIRKGAYKNLSSLKLKGRCIEWMFMIR